MSKRQGDSLGVSAARVLTIFVATVGLLGLLWFALLASKNNERKSLEQEINAMQTELAKKGLLLGPDILRQELNKEIRHNGKLLLEWSNTVSRLNGFQGVPEIATERIGKIDFKVALFDAKQRLLKKARALGIDLTADIGMYSMVKSNEDARRLMYQLKAVETLLDTALDMKINTIKFVEPMEPTGYHPEQSEEIFVEEYPVRIRLYGNVKSLYDLLSSALASEHFFVLRHLKVRSVSETKPDLLDISAVMSSLLFVKSPETMQTMKVVVSPVKIAPKGH